MTRVYYKEAIGCFIVYDVNQRASFESALKWKEDLDSKVRLQDGRRIPCVLLGNKVWGGVGGAGGGGGGVDVCDTV